jgi:predicted DCC family thiol-disulfide oxidoreductase YuxK
MVSIVLFDGDCHFCDWSVQFIIRHDHKEIYYFAPLQSERAKVLLEKHQISIDINSLVLIENNKAYMKSSAVLRICRNLQGIWKSFYTFIIIPKSILDLLYDFLAKNRYKWFGKQNKCMIYPEHIRKRFLVD